MKRLLSHDPLSKTSTYHHYDHSTDTTHIETVQDVSQALRYVKGKANDTGYRQKGLKEDFFHVAHVPAVVVVELKQKYGMDCFSTDQKHLEEVLKTIQRHYPHLMPSGKIYR